MLPLSPPILGILLLLLTFASASNNDAEKGQTSKKEQMQQIFNLLRQGEEEIDLDPNRREAVLLIGNAGAGKTTIGLILTTDCTELEAYEDPGGRTLIRDVRGKIGLQTVVSKTIFPDLLINPENNVAFYDCPGFRDTRRRNNSIEFANTIFLKHITDHVNSVKVLMIVNHDSVVPGGSREDFVNLLQSTLNLIRSVEKFTVSVGMVATKVESRRSDEKIINAIKIFLSTDVKDNLAKVLKNPADEPRAVFLLDSLVSPGRNGKSKIQITRVPEEEGFLNEIPEMMETRAAIGDMIYNELEYTAVSQDDFGLAFSVEARELIKYILDEIDEFTQSEVNSLTLELRNHMNQVMETAEDLSFLLLFQNWKELLQPLTTQLEGNSNTTSESLQTTAPLVERLIDILEDNEVSVSLDPVKMRQLEDQDIFLKLLHNVTGVVPAVDTEDWVRPIRRLLKYIQETIDWYQYFVALDRKLCAFVLANNTKFACEDSSLTLTNVTFVSPTKYQQALRTVARTLGLQGALNKLRPPRKEEARTQSIRERLTLQYFNAMVERAVHLQSFMVSTWVKDVTEALGESFVTNQEDVSMYREAVARTRNNALTLLSDASKATTTPQQLFDDIQALVRGQMELDSHAPALMERQQEVFAMLQRAAPELGAINRTSALSPLIVLEAFLHNAIKWFQFLDDLEQGLTEFGGTILAGNSSTNATAMYVIYHAVPAALQEFADALTLTLPTPVGGSQRGPEILPPFLTSLNNILFRTQQLRSAAIFGSMEQVTRAITSHYHDLTPCEYPISEIQEIIRNASQILESATITLSSRSLDPTALAEFLHNTIAALGLGHSDIGTAGLLKRISDQQVIYKIFANVAPILGALDEAQVLLKVQPLTAHLRSAEKWYEFTADIAELLVGQPLPKISSLMGSTNSTQVTIDNWYELFVQTSQFFGLQPPVDLQSARRAAKENGTACYANALASAAHGARSAEIDTAVRKLIGEWFADYEMKAEGTGNATGFVEGMRYAKTVLSQLMNSTSSNATLLDSHDFCTRINTTFASDGNGTEKVKAILVGMTQPCELLQILGSFETSLGMFNTTTVVRRIERSVKFAEEAIQWFEYLNDISAALFTFEMNSNGTEVPVGGNWAAEVTPDDELLGILEPLHQVLSMRDQPEVRRRVSNIPVFMNHFKNILRFNWLRRNEEMMTVATFLGKVITEHYINASSFSTVQDLQSQTRTALDAFSTLQLTAPSTPAALASNISTILSGELQLLSNSQLERLVKHIRAQEEVFHIFGSALPGLSQLKVGEVLAKFMPLTRYLGLANDWYRFLSSLEKELLRTGPKGSSVPSGGQSGVERIQSLEAATAFIRNIAPLLQLSLPSDLNVQVSQVAPLPSTLEYLSRLAHSAYLAKVAEMTGQAELISNQVVAQLSSKSSGMGVEEFASLLESTWMRLKALIDDSGQDKQTPEDLTNRVRAALEDIFGETESFSAPLDAIEKQGPILQALAHASETYGTINSAEVLHPLESISEFTGESLQWYRFLDAVASQLDGPSPNGAQLVPPAPRQWVTMENCMNTLAIMAEESGVPLPATKGDPTQQRPFLHRTNQLLYTMWYRQMEDVKRELISIADELESNYESRAAVIDRLEPFLREIQNATDEFKLTQSSLQNALSASVSEQVEALQDMLLRLQIDSPVISNSLQNIAVKGGSFEKLGRISKELGAVDQVKYTDALAKFSSYLRRTTSWYTFLENLDARLSSFDTQKNRHPLLNALRQAYGEDLGAIVTDPTDFIVHATQKLRLPPPIEFSEYFKGNTRTAALSHLQDLVHRTLLSSTECLGQNGTTITITGQYVLLSEALSCFSNTAIGRMEVIALHTVFIDTNLRAVEVNHGKPFDLLVAARNMYAVSGHNINLSGADGPPPHPPKSTAGSHGSPGHQGQNAGSFYLVADQYDGSTISVVTNGGNGSPGMPGVAGAAGANGESPTSNTWGSYSDPPCDPTKSFAPRVQSPKFQSEDKSIFCGPKGICSGKEYRFYGKDGTPGGKGGDGGKGGPGGKAGVNKVQILSNPEKSKFISISSLDGRRGADGSGGEGGVGGYKGNDFIVRFRRIIAVNLDKFRQDPKLEFSVEWTCRTDVTFQPAGNQSTRAASGPSGSAGGNSAGMTPAPAVTLREEQVRKFLMQIASQSPEPRDVFAKEYFRAFLSRLRGVQI